MGLVANDQAGFRSAADLIAAAKAVPGKIDYGSGGPGSPQHLAMAMFASAAVISLTHVPYEGATQAETDIAAGQIPATWLSCNASYGCWNGWLQQVVTFVHRSHGFRSSRPKFGASWLSRLASSLSPDKPIPQHRAALLETRRVHALYEKGQQNLRGCAGLVVAYA
jgi:hypothetical protein